jgi:uncharacterized RDD family membrane protein YckC
MQTAAPLRSRLLAHLIDVAAVILAIAIVVGLSIGKVLASARRRGADDRDEVHRDEDDALPRFLESPLLRAALWSAGTGLDVVVRNWRSPGYRALGIRRVDARTGGPVAVKSVLIGLLFDLGRHGATKRLFTLRVREERDRVSELQQKLKEVTREESLSREARQRAMMQVYETHGANPLRGCGWQLAGPILAQLLIVLATRDGRTVYDRLTGTIVIYDP